MQDKQDNDYRGPAGISEHLLPAIKKNGFSDEGIRQLLVELLDQP